MVRSARSAALVFARVGAVAFALTACGYLVMKAQRQARVAPAGAEPAPVVEALPADRVPAATEAYLPSSKVLVLDDAILDAVQEPIAEAVPRHEQERAFLYGSKSADISESTRPLLTPGTVVDPVFLPSSKVKTQLNPFQPAPRPQLVPGAETKTDPVFLPTSKSLRLGEITSPAKKPAPPPQSTPPKGP